MPSGEKGCRQEQNRMPPRAKDIKIKNKYFATK
jgi:hypothetical protein